MTTPRFWTKNKNKNTPRIATFWLNAIKEMRDGNRQPFPTGSNISRTSRDWQILRVRNGKTTGIIAERCSTNNLNEDKRRL